jgi:maltose O-acetyltransferase
MKHKILLIYTWFIRTILFFLPDIPFIMRFRGFLYGISMKQCGRNFQVSHNAILNGLEGMKAGNNVFIANYNVLIVSFGITIEDDVIIGPACVFSSSNHTYSNGSFRYGKRKSSPIFIGKGSWIASQCTILAGSYIPEGTLLAAGSVYNKKKDDNPFPKSLFGGVPAKFIKLL